MLRATVLELYDVARSTLWVEDDLTRFFLTEVWSALSGEAAATIEAATTARAASIKWWMACKTARYEMFGALAAYFPAEPPAAGMDQQAALDHLVTSDYWREHRQALASYTPQYLAQRVAEIGADYDAHLVSGEWRRSFSGKEIFRHIRSEIPGLVAHAKGGTPAENDENLAVLIARELWKPAFNNSSTAQLFKEMRAALRARAGLPP